jgi:hypothetical protein
MSVLQKACHVEPLDVLSRFRVDFYECLTARADALFELADAVLCADGPVKSLVGLSLAAEHRRGHGALYDGVNHGGLDVQRLRVALAGLPLPRCAGGRLVLAVDVTPWLGSGYGWAGGDVELRDLGGTDPESVADANMLVTRHVCWSVVTDAVSSKAFVACVGSTYRVWQVVAAEGGQCAR